MQGNNRHIVIGQLLLTKAEWYSIANVHKRIRKQKAFTIVELLIVIVVIAVLAAVTIVAFNGIRQRAQTTKIKTDLAMLSKAVQAARINSGEVATRYVTGSTGTASQCVVLAADVDLSDRVAAATCWTAYDNALNTISNASNMNIRGLVDPWGRPYFIDENEKEGVTLCGNARDVLGAYPLPRTQSSWAQMSGTGIYIPYITPGC